MSVARRTFELLPWQKVRRRDFMKLTCSFVCVVIGCETFWDFSWILICILGLLTDILFSCYCDSRPSTYVGITLMPSWWLISNWVTAMSLCPFLYSEFFFFFTANVEFEVPVIAMSLPLPRSPLIKSPYWAVPLLVFNWLPALEGIGGFGLP